MPVLTGPGHATEMSIGRLQARISSDSDSLKATTPNLDTVYGASHGPTAKPAIDATLTTWPPPALSMRGSC
jgi:hypothetical protein